VCTGTARRSPCKPMRVRGHERGRDESRSGAAPAIARLSRARDERAALRAAECCRVPGCGGVCYVCFSYTDTRHALVETDSPVCRVDRDETQSRSFARVPAPSGSRRVRHCTSRHRRHATRHTEHRTPGQRRHRTCTASLSISSQVPAARLGAGSNRSARGARHHSVRFSRPSYRPLPRRSGARHQIRHGPMPSPTAHGRAPRPAAAFTRCEVTR